ncbi:hypothetical protein [Pedobacter sp. SG918]|nr:hypothetical protein [Pedobacter sp. SG918]NII82480.1 hypothetical protein [Pedobacter sp. SG908]NMN36505.1 hypothetical protein [Pedobacter sp. SG918]
MFIAYLNIFKALRLYLYQNLIKMEVHIYYLFIMALPVACIAWTVTKEEIFREAREFCIDRSKNCNKLVKRKFFYVFTCEYCFSHYVTALLLFITKFTLIYPDWRGYIISFFSVVWIANVYMSLYNIIRIDLKKEKIKVAREESELKND